MNYLPANIEQGLEPAKVRKTGAYTYLCYPLNGDLTKCMIKRIYEPDQNTTDIDYPFGQALFKFDWEERENYDYQHKKY